MIVDYNFSTDEDNREDIPAGKEFPFVIKYTDFARMTGGSARWHWHDFFEITIPLADGMILQTPDQTIMLDCGEAAFLNSSMLHTVTWKNEPESKTCYTFFFDRSILTGEYGSIFEEKYVTPLTMCRSLDIYPIRPRDKAGLRMMTLIDDIIGYFKNEEFGYEMKSRSALSELWLILLKETEELRKNARKADPTDSQRMKQMMNYVHEHYRDKIYLEEISSSAGISPRECEPCPYSAPAVYIGGFRPEAFQRVAFNLNRGIPKPQRPYGFCKIFFKYLRLRAYRLPAIGLYPGF